MMARCFKGGGMRRGVAAFAILVLMSVLAGCGGVAGVYEASEKGPGGEGVTMSLELKSDKTAVFSLRGDNPDEAITQSGTYTVDGNKITVTMDGDAQVFTLTDGKLSANLMGENVVLVKK